MANYVVAVTGGIASGKSAVTGLFTECGITIADADIAARRIVEPGQPALEEIANSFGPHLVVDGHLNRQALREFVFDSDEARKHLEAITHPRIRQLLIQECKTATSPYAIVAIPLLAEGNRSHYAWLNRILLVDVTRETQKNRLLSRDKISESLADKILDAQASRKQRLAIANDVISNMHDLDSLRNCVKRLDQRYRELAAKA
jgi:dephospho-CoA kinase